MARIELITAETDLPDDARRVADRIVATRGEVTPPFQVLLHSPALAERVAELGHLVRSASSLSDADRELATLVTGASLGCEFVWTSHLEAASGAGLSERTIATLRSDGDPIDAREATLASFVRELSERGTVANATYGATHDLLGTRALVDLVGTVAYYTMLARVMGAFEAC